METLRPRCSTLVNARRKQLPPQPHICRSRAAWLAGQKTTTALVVGLLDRPALRIVGNHRSALRGTR